MRQHGQDRPPTRRGASAFRITAWVFVLLLGGAGGALAQGDPSTNLPDDHPVQVRRRAEAARKAAPRREAAAPAPPPAPDLTPAPAAPAPPAPSPATSTPPAAASSPAPPPPAMKIEGAGVVQADEAATMRADVAERLKALETPPGGADGADPKRPIDPAAKQAAKAMQDVLQERKQRLEDYDKAYKDLTDLKKPDADPVRQLADAKAELQQMQDQSSQPLETLIPSIFTQLGEVDEAGRAQMKEAIEGVQSDIKEYQDRLEATAPEPAKEAKGPLAALRGERDKIAQRLAALKARVEGQADAPSAKTAADRKLAEEKGVNLRIETTVETLRAQVVELKITKAARAAEIAEVNRKAWIAHVRLNRKLLEKMQGRYRELAEAEKLKLVRKAEDEEKKAQATRDPLERYRAGRLAELLELEASAVKIEQALTASPSPSLEEQRGLAAKAGADFERIKRLLEEGRLSPLDTILLNTSYRGITPERERLRRNELAEVEKQLSLYGNALTTAELELIEDSLVDQVELLNLLDVLPPGRHAEAGKVVEGLETKHRDLLMRRRDALRKLVERVSETNDQVNRRLAILDEEYTFIRTHLFWIRDKEPIGASTFSRGAVEIRRLAPVILGLAREATTPRSWRRLTPEFLAMALLSLTLPLGLFRLRRSLKRRLFHALPPAHLHGDEAQGA